MSRKFASLALLLLAVPPVAAQKRQPGDPIPLTLSPAPLPVPSTRYSLLPEPRELEPGNAAALYYRAHALLAEHGDLLLQIRGDQWYKWLETPLKDLPLEEVRDRLRNMRLVLHEVDLAARRRQCDWQLAGRQEGVALLVPEIQVMRQVAVVLGVRARYELAQGHLPEALYSLQTGYALARHLGTAPTLIHVLVGMAIANLLDAQLDEFVQQPTAPNLYWSLTVLPRPYFDPGIAVQEESSWLESMWPGLKRLEEGPMTAAEMEDLQKTIRQTYERFNAKGPGPLDVAAQSVMQAAAYADARKSLLSQGIPAEQVEAMPPSQVVMLYAVREWHHAWDEYSKWIRVPNFGNEPAYLKARQKLQEAADRLYRLVFVGQLFEALEVGKPIPFEKVFKGMGRIERRFDALRCVEAIRLYAAGHDGKLPAALKDITEGPIPADPMTGKPFEYEVKGDRARLSAPPLPGPKPLPAFLLTYEITLRR
jgi:hypothetical protein